jgi:SAM-dependent methyltransferase
MNAGRTADDVPVANEGWKDYWKEDRRASCVAVNPATDEEIAARWRAIFQALPDGSRILDVATGNGIVLVHAARAAQLAGHRFSLTGVDLAPIDPPRYVSGLASELVDARFIGGVAAERLPFEPASFDVVVSQYGLEYADLGRALAEVHRVLRPGGSFAWLAHTGSSEVVTQNHLQAREVDFLLASGGPVDVMSAFVAELRRGPPTQASFGRLQAALTRAEQFCRQHAPARVVWQVCSEFADVANRHAAYRPGDLVAMMRTASRRLREHRQRIEDLRRAVITPARESLVREHLRGPAWRGAELSTVRVGSGGSPIGMLISAQRAQVR